MKVGILCNGAIEDYQWLESICQKLDRLICADGGTNHAYQIGLRPTMIVGDLDSIEPQVLSHYQELGVLVKRFPAEKDETDLQLAMLEALDLGADQVVLLGALGKRVDHSLGNISLLAYLHARGVQGRVLDEHNEVTLAENEAIIEGKVGGEVSLLPLTTKVTGLYTENLKYPLQDGVFTIGNPYGISNVLTAPRARVTIAEGLLLVIKSLS